MAKSLGIDLGTNSIGLSVRDTDNGNNILEQLDFFNSVIFKSGVAKDDSGFTVKSYAAERTKYRSSRRLYQSRKYRIWETLKVLIEFGYCPLSKDDLDKWSKYDKSKGLKRQYPVNATTFEQWVRLDFNGDGVADYTSPYQLRAELIEKQFDFSQQIDKYKLGRALYHIAQRRGFKSSKGETLKSQEENEIKDFDGVEMSIEHKSEKEQSNNLTTYMLEHNLETVGYAFAHLEKSGVRIRNSQYQAVRSQYEEEIVKIFNVQNDLDLTSDFFKRIISKKKGEGTIFYKRPLRSQKGLIGKCTLEPSKSRCPISHPEFEEFRAWSFINNIKYREQSSDEWQTLTIKQKQTLYNEKFLRTTANFKFVEITKWLEKQVQFPLSFQNKTINYKDRTNVSGCPISGRLRNLLGDLWKEYSLETIQFRENFKTGEKHQVNYDYKDIWHICFSYEDAENVIEFAKNHLSFNDNKAREMVRIWGAIQQGYAMLSLKAIRNINRFLRKGLIYSDAVLLAKLPEILGEEIWLKNEEHFLLSINQLTKTISEEKKLLSITNNLISTYKSLNIDEQFAYKNTDYKMTDIDFREIEKFTSESIGSITWERMEQNEKKTILNKVSNQYQQFFNTNKRDYFRFPKLGDAIKKYISDNFVNLHCPNGFIDKKSALPCNCEVCKKLNKLYHPSQIEFYKPSKETRFENEGVILSKKLLESPVIGSFKNPMAMRALHILRQQINNLLIEGVIDEDTRIVVETAREMNDANMRWAIEGYQREREKENKEFEAAIKRHFPERIYTDDDIDKVRLLIDQQDISEHGETIKLAKEKKKVKQEKVESYKKDITKYRLWLEQGCRCIYTGKLINISNLFDDNKVDFEHTIPRSISFDNSLANLTVCDAYYNRTTKTNKIPAQLENYNDILARIQPWIEKTEQLKDNVDYYLAKSKHAQDKIIKDSYIRQRHLWQMELEYWRSKVERFTMQEVTSGFKNSQLNDTRIITKYAFHYLKSVFNNVEVQKGSVTSDFRKMLGVQSIYDKKNREKHSHHAIDATILTMIPKAAKRDKMLKLFYQKEEARKLKQDFSTIEDELKSEIFSCRFGDIRNVSEFIENNILVNHLSKDQTLTTSKRRARIRGKEVLIKDSNGKLTNKWIKGDSIRGKLHGETFYGAITEARKDASGSILRDEYGKILIKEQLKFVVRRELKHKKNSIDTGFPNWNDLEEVIVDKHLFKMMKSQFDDSTSLKEACNQGVYMIDRKGNKVNRIRHIRCIATKIKNPLVIKKQTYLSDKGYKQNYYAEMGDLYVMCKYQSKDFVYKEYIIYSLFDISQNRLSGIEDIPCFIQGRKQVLFLTQTIKAGDMILIYRENPEELKEMDNQLLSKRLYVVRGFENGGKRIILRQHINAEQEKDLGKGESIKDFSEMPQKIRCGINTLKFLLQNQDFRIQTNKIFFYD